MAGVERVNAGFEFLAVTAGVESVAEIVMPEDGQLRNRVTDPVVASRKDFGRMKLSEAEASVWKLISEISPILPSPMLVAQAVRQAVRI
jgi:hypothetical protein